MVLFGITRRDAAMIGEVQEHAAPTTGMHMDGMIWMLNSVPSWHTIVTKINLVPGKKRKLHACMNVLEPHQNIDGKIVGNAANDRARQINDVREAVAGFYTVPSCPLSCLP
jgi:hypothetical protein